MEIQYLKTVLLVATHLNFSKVAEEIPCAPSSVSRQVKCVEEALGITLFDRPARGERLKLTGPGTSVLPYIAQVVGQYESLEFHISRLKGQDEKPYTIGLPLGRISIKTECLLMENSICMPPGTIFSFYFTNPRRSKPACAVGNLTRCWSLVSFGGRTVIKRLPSAPYRVPAVPCCTISRYVLSCGRTTPWLDKRM